MSTTFGVIFNLIINPFGVRLESVEYGNAFVTDGYVSLRVVLRVFKTYSAPMLPANKKHSPKPAWRGGPPHATRMAPGRVTACQVAGCFGCFVPDTHANAGTMVDQHEIHYQEAAP